MSIIHDHFNSTSDMFSIFCCLNFSHWGWVMIGPVGQLQVCWGCTWIPACTGPSPALEPRLGEPANSRTTWVGQLGDFRFSVLGGLLEVIGGLGWLWVISIQWWILEARELAGCRSCLKQEPRWIQFFKMRYDARYCRIFHLFEEVSVHIVYFLLLWSMDWFSRENRFTGNHGFPIQ